MACEMAASLTLISMAAPFTEPQRATVTNAWSWEKVGATGNLS
jgi:hypothetical protein